MYINPIFERYVMGGPSLYIDIGIHLMARTITLIGWVAVTRFNWKREGNSKLNIPSGKGRI